MLRGTVLVSGIGVALAVLAVSVGGRPRVGGENEVRAFPLKAVQLMTSGGARLQDLIGRGTCQFSFTARVGLQHICPAELYHLSQ